MSKKNWKKCKICGKKTAYIHIIDFKSVPICPACGWAITAQTIDYANRFVPGLEKIMEIQDLKETDILNRVQKEAMTH